MKATYSAFRMSIVGCARCHGDGHDDLWWEPLEHPMATSTDVQFTHWSPCPTNWQPILMRAGITTGGE